MFFSLMSFFPMNFIEVAVTLRNLVPETRTSFLHEKFDTSSSKFLALETLPETFKTQPTNQTAQVSAV